MALSNGVVVRGVGLDFGGQLRMTEYLIDAATFAAIIGAATSGNINLFTTSRYSTIVEVLVKHNAVFGGVSGTFKVSVGVSGGSATQITAATSDLVATAVADSTYQKTNTPDIGTVAAVQITCNAVSSVGNISVLTLGSVSIYVTEKRVSIPNTGTGVALP